MKDDPDQNHNSHSSAAKSLNHEWSLLRDSFVDNPMVVIEQKSHTVDELKLNKKMLSQKRRDTNLRLEAIKNRIEQLSQISENLLLVGSDPQGAQEEIQQLYLEGEKLTSEIQQIENQIKRIHEAEEELTAS